MSGIEYKKGEFYGKLKDSLPYEVDDSLGAIVNKNISREDIQDIITFINKPSVMKVVFDDFLSHRVEENANNPLYGSVYLNFLAILTKVSQIYFANIEEYLPSNTGSLLSFDKLKKKHGKLIKSEAVYSEIYLIIINAFNRLSSNFSEGHAKQIKEKFLQAFTSSPQTKKLYQRIKNKAEFKDVFNLNPSEQQMKIVEKLQESDAAANTDVAANSTVLVSSAPGAGKTNAVILHAIDVTRNNSDAQVLIQPMLGTEETLWLAHFRKIPANKRPTVISKIPGKNETLIGNPNFGTVVIATETVLRQSMPYPKFKDKKDLISLKFTNGLLKPRLGAIVSLKTVIKTTECHKKSLSAGDFVDMPAVLRGSKVSAYGFLNQLKIMWNKLDLLLDVLFDDLSLPLSMPNGSDKSLKNKFKSSLDQDYRKFEYFLHKYNHVGSHGVWDYSTILKIQKDYISLGLLSDLLKNILDLKQENQSLKASSKGSSGISKLLDYLIYSTKLISKLYNAKPDIPAPSDVKMVIVDEVQPGNSWSFMAKRLIYVSADLAQETRLRTCNYTIVSNVRGGAVSEVEKLPAYYQLQVGDEFKFNTDFKNSSFWEDAQEYLRVRTMSDLNSYISSLKLYNDIPMDDGFNDFYHNDYDRYNQDGGLKFYDGFPELKYKIRTLLSTKFIKLYDQLAGVNVNTDYRLIYRDRRIFNNQSNLLTEISSSLSNNIFIEILEKNEADGGLKGYRFDETAFLSENYCKNLEAKIISLDESYDELIQEKLKFIEDNYKDNSKGKGKGKAKGGFNGGCDNDLYDMIKKLREDAHRDVTTLNLLQKVVKVLIRSRALDHICTKAMERRRGSSSHIDSAGYRLLLDNGIKQALFSNKPVKIFMKSPNPYSLKDMTLSISSLDRMHFELFMSFMGARVKLKQQASEVEPNEQEQASSSHKKTKPVRGANQAFMVNTLIRNKNNILGYLEPSFKFNTEEPNLSGGGAASASSSGSPSKLSTRVKVSKLINQKYGVELIDISNSNASLWQGLNMHDKKSLMAVDLGGRWDIKELQQVVGRALRPGSKVSLSFILCAPKSDSLLVSFNAEVRSKLISDKDVLLSSLNSSGTRIYEDSCQGKLTKLAQEGKVEEYGELLNKSVKDYFLRSKNLESQKVIERKKRIGTNSSLIFGLDDNPRATRRLKLSEQAGVGGESVGGEAEPMQID